MNFQFKMNVKTTQVKAAQVTQVNTAQVTPTKLKINKWSMIDRVHKAKSGCGSCGR